MSPGDSLAREPAAPRRWLSIVGIGEDGLEGLTGVARGLVKDAEIVFGGKRHLGLAAALISGAARPWPSPTPSEKLRELVDEHVSTRSPSPDSPASVSLRAPRARPNRVISVNPRAISAARAFWPSPAPSTTPHAIASTFFTAPPISAPTTSLDA